MSAEGDFWKNTREQRKKEQLEYIKRVQPVIDHKISQLRKLGYEVKKITEHQYRLNGVLDIFPQKRCYHVFATSERSGYTDMVLTARKFVPPYLLEICRLRGIGYSIKPTDPGVFLVQGGIEITPAEKKYRILKINQAGTYENLTKFVTMWAKVAQ